MHDELFPGPRNPTSHTAAQQRALWAEKLELMRARQLLASSLDALDVGLEIWDDQDRLVLYNKKSNRLQAGSYCPDDIGKTYQALQHNNRKHTHPGTLAPNVQDLLSAVRATRGTHKEPVLQELPGYRWVNTYEALTPEGYLVIVRVNVTGLVRQGRLLEASNHKLRLQSTTDALTGLSNRRSFDEALATEWQRASRGTGSHLSVLMVDIDHFKQYNDHYGHVAGDQCLRQVAAVLGQCVRRAGELVARYGGEEFVLLLPAADQAHACETAEKCLKQLQEKAIAHAASPCGKFVSMSIGVACLPPEFPKDANAMLNAADAAMYRAKSAGRARYELATQADWDIHSSHPDA